MIERNKKVNIEEDMGQAREAQRAADLLFANGFIKDAISKLYYVLLYHVRGLLLTKGLEPRSHEGALRLFSLHFVKTGVFGAEDAHTYSKLMKYREEADYNLSYLFTKEDFLRLKNEAETLVLKITAHLRDKGYL
ncbi:MAG: HEPN domain-containing protein [Desulfobacterota bacterium]|nr:HEPN domain-containing protein [Thermodesulfobacteriota bacterium]